MNSPRLVYSISAALLFGPPVFADEMRRPDEIGRLVFADLPAPAGSLAVGSLVVRLEHFTEFRDGRVQAELAFFNLDHDASVSFVLNAQDSDATLRNAEGSRYRLIALSHFADLQSETGWTTVAPGSSVAVNAIFAPEQARRGVQPFALKIPLRLKWRTAASDFATVRSFDLNFGGLHRQPDSPRIPDAAPVERVEAVVLQPPTASTADAKLPDTFSDDLAPQIAAMPTARPDARRYLFAVGVNEYDDAPKVPFADRSAQLMTELLRKRYGVPQDNITLITGDDATGLKILGRLNSFVQRLTPGDTVFFYYAGHGLAGRDGKAVYIVPRDAVPGAYEVEMLSLASLIGRLEASPAARVVGFLDTCFSGRVGGDTSLFPGAAPLVPTPVDAAHTVSSGKVTLFLAGRDHQLANAYPERGHRLFSYFIMHGLLRGSDNANEILSSAAKDVRRISARRGAEFLQEPRLEGPSVSIGSFLAAGQEQCAVLKQCDILRRSASIPFNSARTHR